MASYAKLRTDLVTAQVEIDGQTVYNIKDPITGNYFRLREPEYWLINQLDGKTSYENIAAGFQETFGFDIDADTIAKFVARLEELYFLDDGRAEQATSRLSYNATRGKSLFAKLLLIKLKAFNPAHFLGWLMRIYKPFHNIYFLILSLLLMLVGVSIVLANGSVFAVDFGGLFNLGSIAAIIISSFLIVSFHEFAHAVVCRYHGGEVREIGFLLLFFQPCFYADLSDAWLFKKKSHRLAATIAGPFMQMILLSLAAIVWRVTIPGTFPNEVARITTIVCWVTLLFNFNPLIKLDGYYLLSDLVDIPNLRHKAFVYLGNWFKRKILGWDITPLVTTKREKRIYLTYAIFSIIYTTVLLTYLLVILAQFLLAKMGGWGLLLLLAVLLILLKSSIGAFIRGTVEHIKYMRMKAKNPFRVIAWLLAGVSLVIGLFAVPFPHRVSGNVVVRPIAEFSLIVNKFGLLERTLQRRGAQAVSKSGYLQMTSTDMASLDLVPLRRDGDIVSVGDTLAILVSNQVTSELKANIAELTKLENELALLKSPPKQEEVEEAKAQVTAAQAKLDQLTKDFNRVKELVQLHLATKEEYEATESAVEIAKAELQNKSARLSLLISPPKPEEEAVLQSQIEKQQARVNYLKEQEKAQSINSPISGIVEIQSNDNSIIAVVDSREVEVLVPVSDFNINLVKVGQPVFLKVRSYPGRVFEGKVVHVPLTAEKQNEQAYYMVSVVIPNKERLLQKGMTGYAKIHIGELPLAKLFARKIASYIRVEFWALW